MNNYNNNSNMAHQADSTGASSSVPIDGHTRLSMLRNCWDDLDDESKVYAERLIAGSTASKTLMRQFDEDGNSLHEIYLGVGYNSRAPKSKTKEEEYNLKNLDIEIVSGVPGYHPDELIVRFIHGKAGSGDDKSNDEDKENDPEKDTKEKNRMNNFNSLKTFSGDVDLDFESLKISTGNKGNNSSSAVDVYKNEIDQIASFSSSSSSHGAEGGVNSFGRRKGNRGSWGKEVSYNKDKKNSKKDEDTYYKGNSKEVKDSGAVGCAEGVAIPRGGRGKDKKNDRNKKVKHSKDQKESNKMKNIDKNASNAANHAKLDKASDKPDKPDKPYEGRNLSEMSKYTINANANTLDLDAVSTETDEFQLVINKKRMKKPKTFYQTNSGAVGGNASGAYTSANANIITKSKSNTQNKKNAANAAAGSQQQYASLENSDDEFRRKSTSSVAPSDKSDGNDSKSLKSLSDHATKKQKKRGNKQQQH